jgi:hypothetical protein
VTWTILEEGQPRAKREHFCDDCQRIIEPGETYRRVRAIGNDGPQTYKSCAQCSRVVDAIWRYDPDSRWYADEGLDLAEYLADVDGPLRDAFQRRWEGVAAEDVPLSVLPFYPRGEAAS